jgi:PAS domain S-box-containing protein
MAWAEKGELKPGSVPQRITIADASSYAPFSFLDANGQPAGILIDIWKLWSKKTGIAVEFRLLEWEAALELVRTGKADTVAGAFVTEERQRYLDFGQPYYPIATSLFFHKQISGIRGLEDIQGFPVGAIAGDSAVELIRDRFPKVPLLQYGDAEALIEAAVRGEVKVFVVDGEIGRFYLAKHDSRGIIRETRRPVAVTHLRVAVRKGNTQLLAVINQGFQLITPEEISRIEESWRGKHHRTLFPWNEVRWYALGILTVLAVVLAWNIQLRRAVAKSLGEVEQRNLALQESEHRFTQLFNSAPVPMAFASETDNFSGTTWNEAWYQTFGYSPEVAHGHNGAEIGLWESAEDRQRVIDTALRQQSVTDFETQLRRQDGSIRHCSIYGRFIGTTGNRLLMFVYLDITEKKQAEKALRESEARFSKAFALSPAPMVISDIRTGRYIDVNEQWLRMIGYTREESIGRTSLEQHIWDDLEVRVRLVGQLMEHGSFRDEPVRFVTKSGNRRDARWSALVVNLGGVEVMLSIFYDDTERKQAEDELRTSESYNKVLFHDSHIPLAVIDPALGQFIDANQAAVRIYGFTDRQALLGKEPKDVSAPVQEGGRSSDILAKELLQRVGAEGALVFEWRHRRPDGTVWEGEVHLMSFCHRNRRLIQLSLQDITGHKQAEKEREKLQNQLLQSQKLESIGRLAGGVAHDFNNMLSVIIGHAELMLNRTAPGQPWYTDLRSILDAAERSADLTRQLLAFARRQTVNPKLLDVNETVDGMLKMVRRLIGEDIELAWQPGSGTGRILMDPSQLDQVLVNLCVNARDAIEEKGRITIKTETVVLDAAFCEELDDGEPGEYVLLTVRDNGSGIDQALVPHLFEPFFTTKELGKGTGLGLATLYGIVKQNNGLIRLESTPGKGTAFHVYLPRFRGNSEHRRESVETPSPESGSETILLVEDEAMILDIGTTMLEMQGYRVLAAATPGEALRLARKHVGEIHLLMTDVVMPEMNGRDLAKQILSLYPNIKRLFMSGYTADVIAHHGVLDEGVHFLQKPFTLESLTAKVRDVLEADHTPGNGFAD